MTTDAASIVVVVLFALFAGVVRTSSDHAIAANHGAPSLSVRRRTRRTRPLSNAVEPRDLADCGIFSCAAAGHLGGNSLVDRQSESPTLEHSGGPPLFCVRCRN
jgi:hypothetical protein